MWVAGPVDAFKLRCSATLFGALAQCAGGAPLLEAARGVFAFSRPSHLHGGRARRVMGRLPPSSRAGEECAAWLRQADAAAAAVGERLAGGDHGASTWVSPGAGPVREPGSASRSALLAIVSRQLAGKVFF
mmetsp:Transcript_15927/g.45789  ORF Transcript_15927/g.45789 Transcript_15927/m.45789 type:complete len:131 (-) Transcript_15927:58-450(-)